MPGQQRRGTGPAGGGERTLRGDRRDNRVGRDNRDSRDD
jgi:small subunit ribosomal protein S5